MLKRGIDELTQYCLRIKKGILTFDSLDSEERKQVRSSMSDAMQIAD